MTTIGQPTGGGGVTPGTSNPQRDLYSEGPPDENGLPKYTITETRSTAQKFGEAPVHTRKFKAVQEVYAGSKADQAAISQAINVQLKQPHPAFPGCQASDFAISETTEETESGLKLITEVTVTYTVIDPETPDVDPLSKPDIWTFQTQGASIAALFYFDNNTIKPLTNSAGDYIKGLQGDEAQTKVVIKGNRAAFPSAIATALTNCVNGDGFLGAGPDYWKCQGISGQVKYETVNEVLVKYWEITVELLYRQTGWNLQIPDIGFNFVEGGQKKRAMVFDDENKVWVASADPIALDGNGGKKAAGQPPFVLDRRLYRRVNFSNYFGLPPE